jgi:hypothetical protein
MMSSPLAFSEKRPSRVKRMDSVLAGPFPVVTTKKPSPWIAE